MKHKRLICFISVVVLLLFVMVGCDPEKNPPETTPAKNTGVPTTPQNTDAATEPPDTGDVFIDWALHGVWVNEDGAVLKEKGSEVLEVRGPLPTIFKLLDRLEYNLEFAFWEGSVRDLDSGEYHLLGYRALKREHQHCYIGHIFLEFEDILFREFNFMICLEEEFLVGYFDDEHVYFVASLDPNADPAEIFAFYRDCINRNPPT